MGKSSAPFSAALNIPIETFDGWSWVEVLYAYTMVMVDQLPDTKLPMLNPTGNLGKIPTWHYKGRTWNYYAHMLAREYGWSLEYISDLDRNDALALIQEILTDEQLRKEFEYGMSEIAYPYNKSTKKSEFKPLERPFWMLPKIEQPKKIKIRKDFLPVGNIISRERHEEKQAPPTKS